MTKRFGKRLIYGGVAISLARSIAFNGLANAAEIIAINAGSHVNPLTAGDTVPATLAEFVRTLGNEQVAYTLTQVPSLRRRDIVNYANTHKCVSTVVIDSLEGWESVAADKASDPWQQLACPLVTATSAKAKPSTHD